MKQHKPHQNANFYFCSDYFCWEQHYRESVSVRRPSNAQSSFSGAMYSKDAALGSIALAVDFASRIAGSSYLGNVQCQSHLHNQSRRCPPRNKLLEAVWALSHKRVSTINVIKSLRIIQNTLTFWSSRTKSQENLKVKSKHLWKLFDFSNNEPGNAASSPVLSRVFFNDSATIIALFSIVLF